MYKNNKLPTRKPAYWAVMAALASMPVLSMAALAETSEAISAETLPEVSVQAGAASATGEDKVTGYVAREATTATKTDTPLIEVPQSISVVTENQIEDQGSLSLQEAVRYTAGVTAEGYGLDNRGDWLFIRGTEHTEYRDGLRVQSQTFNMPRPHPYSLESIEVLRGPSSVLYGASTVGGTINLISKKPQAEEKREINLQYGTRDYKQVGIDLTGPANEAGNVLYRFVSAFQDTDTQVDFTEQQNWFIAPSVTFLPSDRTSLTLLAQFQRFDTDGATAGFPPHSGTISPNPNGDIPTRRFTGEPGYDHYTMRSNAVGWQFSHEFDERWTFRQNARVSRSKLDYATLYPAIFSGIGGNPYIDADQRQVNRFGFANKEETDTFVIDNQLQSKWYVGETHHTVLLGYDHLDVEVHRAQGGSFSTTPFDLYDPVYGNVPASELATVVDLPNQKVRQQGIYLQDQIRMGDHWTVTAGIRQDTVDNKQQGGDTQDDRAFTKRFGVVYLADNGLAPYFSYSESFNPEIGIGPSGQPYKPKRGKQYEVGMRYQPDSKSMYTVSLYDLEEKNRLTSDPAGGPIAVQLAEADVRGVELDAVTRLTPDIDLLANYTYTHARTSGIPGEKYVAEVHPHVANLWATYKFSIADITGFKVGAGARFIGKNEDQTGTLDIPSVTLFDAMFAYDAKDWSASINALNITDKTYIASCLSRGDCWYGSRARVVANLTFRF